MKKYICFSILLLSIYSILSCNVDVWMGYSVLNQSSDTIYVMMDNYYTKHKGNENWIYSLPPDSITSYGAYEEEYPITIWIVKKSTKEVYCSWDEIIENEIYDKKYTYSGVELMKIGGLIRYND